MSQNSPAHLTTTVPRRAVVTGAAGFIGSHLARSLTGHEVQVHQEHPRSGDVLTTRANRGRAQEVLVWQPQVDLHNGMHAHMRALAAELHAEEPRSHGLRSSDGSAPSAALADLALLPRPTHS